MVFGEVPKLDVDDVVLPMLLKRGNVGVMDLLTPRTSGLTMLVGNEKYDGLSGRKNTNNNLG